MDDKDAFAFGKDKQDSLKFDGDISGIHPNDSGNFFNNDSQADLFGKGAI